MLIRSHVSKQTEQATIIAPQHINVYLINEKNSTVSHRAAPTIR